MYSEAARTYLEETATERDRWIRRNRYYHQQVAKLYAGLIPPQARVLVVGCQTGDLLASLQPRCGIGLEVIAQLVKIASRKYPQLKFCTTAPEALEVEEPFDYIVLADVIGNLEDIQATLSTLHRFCTPATRLITSYYNFLWEPLVRAAERLRLKMPQPLQSWLSPADITNLLQLSGFEVIRQGQRLLLPKRIPIFSYLINRYLAPLPLLRHLCLIQYLVARPRRETEPVKGDYLCSVVIPCRNERGNIEAAVRRTPQMGTGTEIIFVEGGSTDGTLDEIKRVQQAHGQTRTIMYRQQPGRGKCDAVRTGFEVATGDVLMILDADLTVRPEDLPKFYQVLISGRGELVQGSRLVYPLAKQAMRLLNLLGNKFFGMVFTWLLDQRVKDTLCGTKVLFRWDYERIKAVRHHFGNFDPFGDFELLFGAAKANLKILEIPIRYQERGYGTTNIQRFRHGWLLLKMCVVGLRRFKLY